MRVQDKAILDSLAPVADEKIMDLVREAEIDVSKWARRADGGLVDHPKANPQYCYEWAFGGDFEPTLLCIWHRDIRVDEGIVSLEDNYRAYYVRLQGIADDRVEKEVKRARVRSQAKRALNFDLLLQRAFRKKRPIRVVTLVGEMRDEADIGMDSSEVRARLLDFEPWAVTSYDDNTGKFRLVRGWQEDTLPNPIATFAEQYVDQFSLPVPHAPLEAVTTAYDRSSSVRLSVLNRASGVCECCREQGFRTASGAIYLETHHVFPLSTGGPDVEWNMVAICPNDHRRAHYGSEWVVLRDEFVSHLLNAHPRAATALEALQANQSSSVAVP